MQQEQYTNTSVQLYSRCKNKYKSKNKHKLISVTTLSQIISNKIGIGKYLHDFILHTEIIIITNLKINKNII